MKHTYTFTTLSFANKVMTRFITRTLYRKASKKILLAIRYLKAKLRHFIRYILCSMLAYRFRVYQLWRAEQFATVFLTFLVPMLLGSGSIWEPKTDPLLKKLISN